MHALAEQPDRLHRQARLLDGLPHGRFPRGLAGLDAAGRELPHQLAFGDAAADHQHFAAVDDNRGGNALLLGDGLGHAAASKALRMGGKIWSGGMNLARSLIGTQAAALFSTTS
jgi:hypothetical protein